MADTGDHLELLKLYSRSLRYLSKFLEEKPPQQSIAQRFPDLQSSSTCYNNKIHKRFKKTKEILCQRWEEHACDYAIQTRKADDCKLILKMIWESRNIDCVKLNTGNTDLPQELKESAYSKQLEVLTTMIRLLKNLEKLLCKNKEAYNKLLEEKATLEQRIQENESSISDMMTQIEKLQEAKLLLEDDKSKLLEDIESICKVQEGKLRKPIVTLQQDLAIANKHRKQLSDRLCEYEEAYRKLQKEKETLERSSQQHPQTAPVSYTEHYKEMKQTVENLKSEKESLIQRINNDSNKPEDETIQSISCEPGERLKEKDITLQQDLMTANEETKKLTKRLCKNKEAYKKLLEEKETLEQRLCEYEEAYRKLQKEKETLERGSQQRPQTAAVSYAEHYKEMQQTVKNLKSEKESLMQRLNRLAGMIMKDNNAAIADLNDPNRPEKLAEKFGEIYDNAWTDVLDVITENTKVSDEDAVKQILQALQIMYSHCNELVNKNKKRMITAIGYPKDAFEKPYTGGKDGHDATVKIIKNLVQQSVERISENVIKKIKDLQDIQPIIENGGDKADIFISQCSKLCLFMCVQDPPVILDFSCQSGDHFDKERFSHFTSSGEVVDYLVWPVMYLSANGALMNKGIAQGKKCNDC